jgi:hypothetical protein
MGAQRWAEAESTWARVRELGDTLPGALRGQAAALRELGQAERAQAIEQELRRRWPTGAERLQ